MRRRRQEDPRLAVVDVETTGFSKYGRIVEFACVTVVDGAVVEEYETLIQPERDPGPVHIHGITPEMLQAAAPFETVAALVDVHAPRGTLRDLQAASRTPPNAGTGMTMRRPGSPPRRGSLHQAAARTRWPGTPEESTALYLDALDRCLDDGILEDTELAWLDDTAKTLGLSSPGRAQLHEQYFELLKRQILADGIVTLDEEQLAAQIAEALALGPTDIRATHRTADRVELKAGMNVCFTGTAVISGAPANRELLEKIATLAGMTPMRTVTKKCDVLVAADPLSQSGKARTARERGIPIISIEDFMDAT